MRDKTEALKEIVSPFNEYKKSSLFLEYITGSKSSAASNEVNNAFEHLVRLIENQDQKERLELELDKIKSHLHRAAEDNLKLALLNKKDTLNKLATSKYTDELIASEAKQLDEKFRYIYESLSKDNKKNDYLSKATDNIIMELDKMEFLNEKYRLMLTLEKKQSVYHVFRMIVIGVSVAAAASIIMQLLQKL